LTDESSINAAVPLAGSASAESPKTERLHSSYNATIDYLRLIAALVIVLFHAKSPLGHLFSSSVSFFIMAMIFFAMHSRSLENPISEIVANRADRLLTPFAFWIAVYAIAKTLQNTLEHGNLNNEFSAWLPPAGTFGHLWFLPFAFAVTVALGRWIQWLRSVAKLPMGWLGMLGVSILVTWPALTQATRAAPEIAGMMIYFIYLPSVAFGVVIALTHSRIARFAVAVGAFGLGVVLAPFSAGQAQQLLVGIPLAVLALDLKFPETKLAHRLGKMSMGIYLTHPLVIAALPRVTGIEPSTILGGVLCCLGACALTLAIDATPLRRFI